MNKKSIIVLVLVLIIGLATWRFLTLPPAETVDNGTISESGQEVVVQDKSDLIQVFSIQPYATVTSPLVIEGKARGTWYFEASFPVKLFDSNGTLLAVGIAQADGDWMTEQFVPFILSIPFSVPTTTNEGILMFEKDNPSGLPEHDDSFSIPVLFAAPASSERSVLLYYYDASRDMDEQGNVMCSSKGLVSVTRRIPFTASPVQDTIKLLLKGAITQEERMSGVNTEFPLRGLSLQGAALNNGALTLNFSDQYQKTVGGSCRVGILWAQIQATAKQFSGVESVQFMPGDLFQP